MLRASKAVKTFRFLVTDIFGCLLRDFRWIFLGLLVQNKGHTHDPPLMYKHTDNFKTEQSDTRQRHSKAMFYAAHILVPCWLAVNLTTRTASNVDTAILSKAPLPWIHLGHTAQSKDLIEFQMIASWDGPGCSNSIWFNMQMKEWQNRTNSICRILYYFRNII